MSRWATEQDCEKFRQMYPLINSREFGYISAEKSDPEFGGSSFEDYYMTWEEATIDGWYNCFSDASYEECKITFKEMKETWEAAEANRLSRQPK